MTGVDDDSDVSRPVQEGSEGDRRKRRLAIVGGGSSGLVTLKTALEALPEWEIICFEKSDSVVGCWGNPHAEFVSTSTKYTTQFACFGKYDASVSGEPDNSEFFLGGEFGQYLTDFAREFELTDHVKLHCRVDRIEPSAEGLAWTVRVNEQGVDRIEHFDQVIVCTGLAAVAKEIKCQPSGPDPIRDAKDIAGIRGQRVVVMGGGESAVDIANRLASPESKNEVFLSLRNGIRVSPRYHPIRGVPSDFLRNRLMLSIHVDLRNRIGHAFVYLRNRYNEQFERWFPARSRKVTAVTDKKRDWSLRLFHAAKEPLFNMFHNKSDDFLTAVGDGRLEIIGPPTDESYQSFHSFDQTETQRIDPQRLIPAIGFRSTLTSLTEGAVSLEEFYLGCVHSRLPGLYAIGFARPVIGSIPPISEIQAAYVCGLIAERRERPSAIESLCKQDAIRNRSRYGSLDLSAVYPVEMFPYCDKLVAMSDGFARIKSRDWFSPATTLHYIPGHETSPIYMPAVLILLLLMLKPLDWIYRYFIAE